jgi:hypothetical protein
MAGAKARSAPPLVVKDTPTPRQAALSLLSDMA